MQMPEIRAMARDLGIKAGRATKADLVRHIQRTEGNFDCYGSADQGICDQTGCRWRGDCFREARRNHRGAA
jgi:hypothetical protein